MMTMVRYVGSQPPKYQIQMWGASPPNTDVGSQPPKYRFGGQPPKYRFGGQPPEFPQPPAKFSISRDHSKLRSNVQKESPR